jgi:hypothetical protein
MFFENAAEMNGEKKQSTPQRERSIQREIALLLVLGFVTEPLSGRYESALGQKNSRSTLRFCKAGHPGS